MPILTINAISKNNWTNIKADPSNTWLVLGESKLYVIAYSSANPAGLSAGLRGYIADIESKVKPSLKFAAYANDIVSVHEYQNPNYGFKFKYSNTWALKEYDDTKSVWFVKNDEKQGLIKEGLPWIAVRSGVSVPGGYQQSEVKIINDLKTVKRQTAEYGTYSVAYYILLDGKTYSIEYAASVNEPADLRLTEAQDIQLILATFKLI